MTSEVAELLTALRSGEMSLAEVADRFRHKTWPRTRRSEPADLAELAEQTDPAAEIPGSFDDVLAAYDRGEISRREYRALVEAAAESVRAEYGQSAQ